MRKGWWSVHHPDSLMEEAVFQSAGPCSETPQSPAIWEETEDVM